MPLDNVADLAAFRLIRGSKQERAADPEPVADPSAEVVDSLVNAAESAAGSWVKVFVIFEDSEGVVDFMYSTTTDPEKLMLIERAKAWLMDPTE